MKKCTSIYQMSMRTFTPDGTLKAAEKLLPYVAELGFEYVYILPVCEADRDNDINTWSWKNECINNPACPYKLIDYFNVDPEYGTNEDLRNFINYAHKCGLKIIMDLVYLHCGRNIYHLSEDPDFLIRDENGNIPLGERWPFARINFNNQKAREYLWDNMVYYIKDYKADGFRCDCGDMVPIDFWEEGIRRVREINPDVLMINEGYNRDTLNHGFDMIYTDNDMITEPNSYYMITGKITVDEWKNRMSEEFSKTGKFIRFTENHDLASVAGVARLEALLGTDKFEAYMALCYVLNGVPFIWNGNEFCDKSVNKIMGNREFGHNSLKWIQTQTEEGKRRISIVKILNKMRADYPELQTAETEILPTTGNVIYIKRRLNAGFLTAIFNFGEEPFENKKPENIIASNNITQGDTVLVNQNGYYIAKSE